MSKLVNSMPRSLEAVAKARGMVQQSTKMKIIHDILAFLIIVIDKKVHNKDFNR